MQNIAGINAATWDQCYKTFYCGNLPPFHGNTVILCFKARVPWKLQWNCSKLTWYFNPRRSKVKITMEITTVLFYNIGPGLKNDRKKL